MANVGFPVSDYYKDHIIDAETISRSGSWWTAILLVKDPQTRKHIILMYQWQKTGDVWKTRKRFSFKKKKVLEEAIGIMQRFGEMIEELV